MMIEKIMKLLEQTNASMIDKLDIQRYLTQMDNDSLFLAALEDTGVSEWSGYINACNYYNKLLKEGEYNDESNR